MPLPPDVRDAFLIPDGALYLDTASNAPRLRSVHAALRRAWDESAAPWRLSFADWDAQIERVRALGSRLFHADGRADAESVALVPSVAHAMSTIAAGWPLRAGDVVALLDGEFPSTLLPWQVRCASIGAALHAIDRVDARAATLRLLEVAPPAVLVLSQSHWRDGRLLDLDAVADAARARGVPLVLDLSQSLGVLPGDVDRWRPAFAMSVGYNWLLMQKGLCLLWASAAWRERIAPLEQHWQGRAPARPWHFGMDAPPPYRDGARRFDGGEVTEPLRLATAEAALAQLLEWTPAAVAQRLGELTARLRAALDAAGIGDWCLSPASPHLLGIAPPPARLDALRASFAASHVVCIERDGVFRLAPHLHLGAADIDRVAQAIVQANARRG
ncbi:aminotransferase class V-fold PLP-dependent enzyme [Cognatilysobacter segetis]|uniref:aminotransferase class V-fold PLP-dependent enzyme n=1 Tax=Cognatilysobacter segetis TaxID=2492394 RepID=UPI0010616C45|nr:aminotransferase class V-fold PLP-dependent enzyme [Lysobacter segetis]